MDLGGKVLPEPKYVCQMVLQITKLIPRDYSSASRYLQLLEMNVNA